MASVIAACWDPAGRLLATAGDTDGIVRVWDTTGTPPRCRVLPVIAQDKPWLHDVVFTPDGRYLATANPDGTIYILKLADRGSLPFADADR
jgi:WD40 repeat protein